MQKIREFQGAREDENPTIVWTIGTKENKHYQRVSRWILARIHLSNLYTCGINPKMKNDLDSVDGNLERFVDEGSAAKYDEFQINSIPTERQTRIVIGIARAEKNRDGVIELIDGAHRVVAMLANGVTSTQAYIGEIHNF